MHHEKKWYDMVVKAHSLSHNYRVHQQRLPPLQDRHHCREPPHTEESKVLPRARVNLRLRVCTCILFAAY